MRAKPWANGRGGEEQEDALQGVPADSCAKRGALCDERRRGRMERGGRRPSRIDGGTACIAPVRAGRPAGWRAPARPLRAAEGSTPRHAGSQLNDQSFGEIQPDLGDNGVGRMESDYANLKALCGRFRGEGWVESGSHNIR